MACKIAAASSLLAFAVCLILGIAAENTFSTTVMRGLLAMLGTFVIGIIVGTMGEKMYQEDEKLRGKMGKSETKVEPNDR